MWDTFRLEILCASKLGFAKKGSNNKAGKLDP